MSKTYVLHNPSGSGKYYAGVVSRPESGQAIVTTNKIDVAKKFTNKKEAQDRQIFLDNNCYKFKIIEVE